MMKKSYLLALLLPLLPLPSWALTYEEFKKQSCATEDNIDLAYQIHRNGPDANAIRSAFFNPDNIETGSVLGSNGYPIWGYYNPIVSPIFHRILFAKKDPGKDYDKLVKSVLSKGIFDKKGYSPYDAFKPYYAKPYEMPGDFVVVVFKKKAEQKFITVYLPFKPNRISNPSISAPSSEPKTALPEYYFNASYHQKKYTYVDYACESGSRVAITFVEVADFVDENDGKILGLYYNKIILDSGKKPAAPSVNHSF